MSGKLLNKLSEAYYSGNPLLTDEEYDAVESHLKVDGTIGAAPSNKKCSHTYKMYSLKKVWLEDGNDPLDKYETVVTPKLDGSAIAIYYKYGVLDKVLTRGNGVVGEDITDKFTDGRIVPLKVEPTSESILSITGEIVAPKSVPNSRNYATGALHLKSVEEFKEREIYFVAYGVYPFVSGTYKQDLRWLEYEGFTTVISVDSRKYRTDGEVYRVDNNKTFIDLGYTDKYPRGAYALKKRSDVEILESTLKEVRWQVGKGGKITPVAIFDEVVIEDAKITKATLHNAEFVESLDLHIGDTLLITRSGGVIPKIVGVNK
jgi:DNA ligase (NAD+)